MFSFTEEKQQQAPFRSIAGRDERRKRSAASALKQEALLRDSLKHTHTHLTRETVLLGSKNSEARRTQRTFESGMKHVCSIYMMMEFYVFM